MNGNSTIDAPEPTNATASPLGFYRFAQSCTDYELSLSQSLDWLLAEPLSVAEMNRRKVLCQNPVRKPRNAVLPFRRGQTTRLVSARPKEGG